jgi:hypothetical protein
MALSLVLSIPVKPLCIMLLSIYFFMFLFVKIRDNTKYEKIAQLIVCLLIILIAFDIFIIQPMFVGNIIIK